MRVSRPYPLCSPFFLPPFLHPPSVYASGKKKKTFSVFNRHTHILLLLYIARRQYVYVHVYVYVYTYIPYITTIIVLLLLLLLLLAETGQHGHPALHPVRRGNV